MALESSFETKVTSMLCSFLDSLDDLSWVVLRVLQRLSATAMKVDVLSDLLD